MKKTIPILGIIAVVLSGCSSTKVVHVDADEFLQHAQVMEGMHSALSATYIGSTHNRAYLEFNNYITFIRKAPVTYIYWTEIDSLPIEVARKIKKGQAPWVPFDHQKYAKQKLQQGTIDLERDILEEEPIDLDKP